MARVSGGSLLSLQTYLGRAHGAGAWEQVLDGMPPELSEPLRGIILPVHWYPTESFIRAIDEASALFGADFYEKYGSFAAEFEINSFQKLVLRFTSPLYLMDRAGRMWHRFHDSGTWQVEGGGKKMKGTLRDFAIVNGNYCRVLTAWFRRAGEMTGVKGHVDHPQCRARGGEACVFTGWWE